MAALRILKSYTKTVDAGTIDKYPQVVKNLVAEFNHSVGEVDIIEISHTLMSGRIYLTVYYKELEEAKVK